MNNNVSSYAGVIGWIILTAVLHATPVYAQESCPIPRVTDNQSATSAFDELRQDHCLGGNACRTTECQLVSELVAKGPGTNANTAGDAVLAVLRKLHAAITALDRKDLGVSELQGMSVRWSLPSLAATPQSLPTVILQSNTREWQGRALLLFLHTPYELDLNAQLCSKGEGPGECQAEFESAVRVYTLSDLVHATLETVTKDKIDGVGRMLKTYDERWTAFHTKSLAVLPWELIANNFVYRSAAKGFSGPPDYQWIVLHPSAAVIYDTRQHDKMQGAVLLDLVGRYQWKWGGKDEAEITSPWGAALAMSWHGDAPGYGISVHMPHNWSVALTRSSGNQWQVIASIEFAQYITDKQRNVDNIRAALEKVRLQ